MSLGYDLAHALPLLRAQAESRFTETFMFYTESDGPADPVSLEPTTVEAVIRVGVPGRVRSGGTQGQDVEAGGQYPVVVKPEVHVAVGSIDLAPGVFARVTGSDADPSLVGNVFRISEPCPKGQVTAWRYPSEEVS